MVEQRCYDAGCGYRPQPCERKLAIPDHIRRKVVGWDGRNHDIDALLVFDGIGPRPYAVVEVPRGARISQVGDRGSRYFSVHEAVKDWLKWEA